MARQHQIQYVSFYTAGSEARKIDWQPVKKQVNLPQPLRAKRKVVYVDPVANIGIFVAVVMLVVMLVGVVRFAGVHNERVQLQNYVSTLQQKNETLSDNYYSGFDPEEIRQIALAKGYIPAEQAQVLYVAVPETAEQPEETGSLWAFLLRLFA